MEEMKGIRLFLLLAVLLLTACGKSEALPGEILNSQDSFGVTTELVLEIPSVDDNFRVMQGGCVTEQYAWFIVVSTENYSDESAKEAYIVKYDLSAMTEVGRSEVLKLGHANDMTYLPESNELYVSMVYADRIAIVDADTLELKKMTKFRCGNYAIDYVASSEMFVTARGTLEMIFYNKEKKRTNMTMAQNTTLVQQGICADEKYVYHVLYSPKSNIEEPEHIILVLDWEGNVITRIPIGIKEYEPESISLVGDTFYIGFNTGEGGLLYTAKLVKNE